MKKSNLKSGTPKLQSKKKGKKSKKKRRYLPNYTDEFSEGMMGRGNFAPLGGGT